MKQKTKGGGTRPLPKGAGNIEFGRMPIKGEEITVKPFNPKTHKMVKINARSWREVKK